tara:strand:+ start:655 stop:894 length:240 start_codon:yes stop_codon:yes gene_type:complete
MSILTSIGGMPLFSTVQEALQWALSKGLQGYHTHVHNGQTGYMGGSSHGQAASSSQGLNGSNQTTNIPAINNNSGGTGY